MEEQKNELKNCSACGGSLVFTPKYGGSLACKNCGKHFAIQKEHNVAFHPYVPHSENRQDSLKWFAEQKILKCSNCGANIVLNGLEYAQSCPYCNSPAVVLLDELPGLKPDAVIPFQISKEEATDLFIKNVKGKFFLPKTLKNGVKPESIKSTYVTSFVFNCDTVTQYDGTLSYQVQVETEDGKEFQTKYLNVSGEIAGKFENITEESSSLITQAEYASAAPFDYVSSVAFNPDYLRGYVVEHYDEGLDQCFEEAEHQIKRKIERDVLLKHQCDKVVRLNLNVHYLKREYNYTLLPFYFFEFTYKNKKYRSVMNGQTGLCRSRVPRSAVKIFLLIFLIVGPIIAAFIVAMIFAGRF